MKKSVLAVFCAAMMLAGCGGTATETETTETTQETTVEETETTTEETAAKDEEMLNYLKELPAEIPAEAAAEQGFFTIANGEVTSGQEEWDAFLQAAQAGEEASVVLCQYSAHGGAMLDYLTHNAEGGYLLVSDRSRDGYEKDEVEKQDYITEKFAALKVFEHFSLSEGGKEYTIGVLTNEPELDADTFRTYWKEMSAEAHEAYLLFVI